MTTDTNTQANIIDLAALRLDLFGLLSRDDEALTFSPEGATAAEYAARLYSLSEDVEHAADALAHALPALRMLQQVYYRLYGRVAGLSEVFDLDCGTPDYGPTTDIGDRTFWGDIAPVFPALRMDYSAEQPDEGIPF